jgi:hypothetical protein
MTAKCKITRHQQYATSIAKQRLTFALQLLKLQALLVKFCWCPLDIFGRALTWEINLHQLYYNILSKNQCKLEVSNTCKSFNVFTGIIISNPNLHQLYYNILNCFYGQPTLISKFSYVSNGILLPCKFQHPNK